MTQAPSLTAPTLDPHSRELFQRIAALSAAVPAEELTLARRRLLSRQANDLLIPAEGPTAAQRQELRIDLPGRSLPARLYCPEGGLQPGGASDVLLVYFHGGGWVVGDLETHDNACAFLSQRLGCTVLSVEYRKAPENAFPAPCDDTADAYAWAASQLAPWGLQRIAISGDSSGAHLAAHAMFANPQAPTAAALLFYPVADMDFTRPSHTTNAAGPGLTSLGMVWYWEQFLGSAHPSTDPRAVPLRQQWQRKPPPTVVAVALHDPLYDEGVAYAELLRQAGAKVLLYDAQDMAHGFLRQCRANASAARHVEAVADRLLNYLGVAARA